MKRITQLAISGISSLAILGFFQPAQAVNLIPSVGMFSAYSNTNTITFDDGTANDPNNFVTYSNISNNIVLGTVIGEYVSPTDNNTKYMTISPSNTNVAGNSGFVNLTFHQPIDYFGFYAGSLDDYNYLSVYKDNQLLKTFSGLDMKEAIVNSGLLPKTDHYMNIFAESGKNFNRIVMGSNNIAFETDNHAYKIQETEKIPEASTTLGLLVFGTVGSLMIRNRKKSFLAG
ncbi:PEP-CTERM sorting domain-containing protein [Nodularia sp. UHCC 0506]|uniref:Npun_F0296 family exosortase-dependent surface protein n=1 Tax=Nodularia sp. UHCC 0506 TaxID=3110243 RepID=UPI002B1FFE93|nr:PEP-CTERM sorting domain-containing protein [Nodularia sp. UHCC 0506]MEA5516429.1 PEP-CTERM sorting domain-containing protein [Nodularia sp. UHCC 0506]